MFQYDTNQFACLCSPRRKILQTPWADLLISIFFSHIFRNSQSVTYTIFLQCANQFATDRAKSIFKLGLLALFFDHLNCHHLYRRIKKYA